MTTISEQIKQRDVTARKTNSRIFKENADIMNSITAFLTTVDPLCMTGNILWDDIYVLDELIYFTGLVSQHVGNVITHDGAEIEITTDNIDNFQGEIYVTLPIKLVEAGDTNEIVEFLYKLYEEKNTTTIPPELTTPSVALMDFDLSDLSPEQQNSLVDNPTTKKN